MGRAGLIQKLGKRDARAWTEPSLETRAGTGSDARVGAPWGGLFYTLGVE